jgi:hypothetical protein
MRRLALILAGCAALAVPAAALALQGAAGDGSLVIKNGSAPTDTAVVAFVITGSVIGHVDNGRIIIDPGANSDAVPQVTGAGRPTDSTKSDTAQVWKGQDFRFRAVAGKYTIVIFGSGVDLVAVGKGTINRIAGDPNLPRHDGQYSLNGADFVSLPSLPLKQLTIGATG